LRGYGSRFPQRATQEDQQWVGTVPEVDLTIFWLAKRTAALSS
jgi:hypothetical protein